MVILAPSFNVPVVVVSSSIIGSDRIMNMKSSTHNNTPSKVGNSGGATLADTHPCTSMVTITIDPED